MSEVGFPITKNELFYSVKELVNQLGRATPFKDGKPSRKWYQLFLKRHPELSTRVPQNLTLSRAKVSQSNIQQWFTEIEGYLKSNFVPEGSSYFDILSEHDRIFNADEAFFLNPKGSKVICKRGEKNVYSVVSSNEKDCLTVLMNGNAAGKIAPTMVMYPYERLPADIAHSVPEDWVIGRSSSGWMTCESFFEYVANKFHPWLIAQGTKLPVILFIDGHTSHNSLPLSKFCEQNGIILIALYPNATHLLQPMDVAVLKSLKGSWRDEVHKFRLETGSPNLRRSNFAPILKKAMKQSVTPTILMNGFRKCGLFPWDPCAIDYSKIIQADRSLQDLPGPSDEHNFTKEEYKKTLQIVEQQIGPTKKFNFLLATTEDAIIPVEDTNLFLLWKNLVKETENSNPILEGSDGTFSLEANIPCSDLSMLLNNLEDIEVIASEPVESINYDVPEAAPEEAVLAQTVELAKLSSEVERDNQTNCLLTPVMPTSPVPKKTDSFSFLTSPFKRALFYPKNVEEAPKKRKREAIPSVFSSTEYIQYQEKKIQEKQKAEEHKKQRAQLREEKRKQRDKAELKDKSSKIKKHKKSEENQDTQEAKKKIETGTFVVVNYEGELYPGRVVELNDNQIKVSTMALAGPKVWKWPKFEDTCWYDNDDIKEVIEEPTLYTNRGHYRVPEMNKYT